jgi:NADP-dependent 3-hydroxy acid dehydrogenase YdfG
MGYLYFAKAVLPHMVKRNKGHLVFISSAIVFTPMGGYTAYGATKSAVKGTIRNELILID